MNSLDLRRDELAANLVATRARIAAAVAAAGRLEGDVDLVVVTKFFPASDVRLLAGLGVTDVGENRHQEAEAKAAECVDLPLRWHYIGGLQSNKAAEARTAAEEAALPMSSSPWTGSSLSRHWTGERRPGGDRSTYSCR